MYLPIIEYEIIMRKIAMWIQVTALRCFVLFFVFL